MKKPVFSHKGKEMKRFQILPESHLLSWQVYRFRWKFQNAQKELWEGRPAGGNLSSVISTVTFCGLGSLGAPRDWWLGALSVTILCFLHSCALPQPSAPGCLLTECWVRGSFGSTLTVCSHLLGCCLLAASRKKRLIKGSLLLAPLWGSLRPFQHYCVHQNAK